MTQEFHIKETCKVLCFVGLPKEATSVHLSFNVFDTWFLSYRTEKSQKHPFGYNNVCKFDYKPRLLGLKKDLTNEQLELCMPTTIIHQKHKVKSYKYRSFENGFMGFETSKESLDSLMRHLKLYEVNPWEIAYQFDQCRKWQVNEAQSRTFENWGVLVREA